MSSDTSSGKRSHVMVLMFDQLPLNLTVTNRTSTHTADVTEAAAATFSAFDYLDLSSTFFEQYLVQDVRESAGCTESLGGPRRMNEFLTKLAQSNRSLMHIRLRCMDSSKHPDNAESELVQDSNFFRDYAPVQAVDCVVSVISDQDQPGQSVHRIVDCLNQSIDMNVIPDCNLIWIDVQQADTDPHLQHETAAAVLTWFQQLKIPTIPHPASSSVRIVSALRGAQWNVCAPFSVQGDESRTHVPLWIDHGAGHSCRIQNLAGSFDLLPTISEFLSGSDIFPQSATHTQTQPFTPSDHTTAMTNLRCAPVSLVSLCDSFSTYEDRLLRLVGDNWTGLRTSHYLVIRSAVSTDRSATDVPGGVIDESLSSRRHLYLKPDDIWNVHDVIVAYEAIADVMEEVANQHPAIF